MHAVAVPSGLPNKAVVDELFHGVAASRAVDAAQRYSDWKTKLARRVQTEPAENDLLYVGEPSI